jgi:hypothetical protein
MDEIKKDENLEKEVNTNEENLEINDNTKNENKENEINKDNFVAKIILSIVMFGLAFFWIITGLIDIINLNTTDKQLRDMLASDFKEGVYLNTYTYDTFGCYLELKSSFNEKSNEWYYFVALADNDMFISVKVDYKLNEKFKKLPFIAIKKEQNENSLLFKGKVRKLDDTCYEELRKAWANLLETDDKTKIDKYAIPYYIDTTASKNAIVRIVEGAILIVLCFIYLLYSKITKNKSADSKKSKILIYISLVLLLAFIVIFLLKINTMFRF